MTFTLPGRDTEAHTIVGEELWTHAGIHLHHGKTKVWNRGDVEPENIAQLTRMARLVRPTQLTPSCNINKT